MSQILQTQTAPYILEFEIKGLPKTTAKLLERKLLPGLPANSLQKLLKTFCSKRGQVRPLLRKMQAAQKKRHEVSMSQLALKKRGDVVMTEFRAEFGAAERRYKNYLKREPTESESNALFLNFLRYKLGLPSIQVSLGNGKRKAGAR